MAPTRRRNTELLLVIAAVVVSLFGDVNVELAMNGKLPGSFGLVAALLTALAIGMHLAVRKWAPYADPLILPLCVLLTGVGLVMIHRLDISNAKVYNYGALAPGQLRFTLISAVVFTAIMILLKHHRILQRYTYLLMAVALVLLAAPAFFSSGAYGAKRWIQFGSITVEPAEFTKLAIIVFFAGYLMANRDALALVGRKVWGVSLPRGRNLGPILAIWAVCLMVLFFEVDLGTALLIFGIFIVMLYTATERTGWVVVGLVLAVAGAVVVGSSSAHVMSRVSSWLHPMDAFKDGTPDQAAQSLFALAHGGFLGTGLGQGQPWLIHFADESDWIFGSIGEELGTTGLMAILLLYVLLAQRSMRSAIRLTDPFGKLLASGIGASIILQVFIVAGGVILLIPETGKALPFLAQGGSSLLASWVMAALMIKLSDSAGRIELEPAPDPAETLTVSAEEIRAHLAENS
jgi:cell division protein FtsW (lipid II flippase)